MQRHTLHRKRWQDRPSARSLLLTVLGEYVYPDPQPVWTRTFVEALVAIGFEPPTVRQALARSSAAGWLVSQRNGRETAWGLTPQSRSILAAGTQRIYGFGRTSGPWEGEWLLLQIALPSSARKLRSRLRARLTWAGFGSLGQGLWISPDPSRQEEAAEILRSLGLAERTTSFRGHPGGIGGVRDLVRRAWDLDTVAQHHRRFLGDVSGIRPRSSRGNFVALTELVHNWRALPFVDPDLPDALLPPRWIGRRAATRFHRLHDRWSGAAQEWWSRLALR